MAIARDTENYGRHPHEGCLGMCSGPHDPDGEVRGCSVGCTIGVSDISASRVLQPRNVPSGVSRLKSAFSSGGVVRGAAKFRVFSMRQGRESEATEIFLPSGQKSLFLPGCVRGAII